ncbi:MAG: Major pilin/Flagellin, FlaG/FlaF family [Nitrosopumilales archaeon]|nr:MAG: Major pilin/Flagellin, FlaG/FlaF family [Nitrosopumilales archaeon]
MNTTTLKNKERKSNHRAVAPVIATLLMVAIAVVGGTIIFVFAQGFFSSSQISGTPQIESVQILGYDARAVAEMQAHDGNLMLADSGGDTDPNKEVDERVAVYITNNSVQKIVLGEISFAGYIYQYIDASSTGLGAFGSANIPIGNYTVLTKTPDTLLAQGAGEIAPGQTATIVLDLESDLKIGRGSQFKLTTSNGNVFVGTVSVGQQSG